MSPQMNAAMVEKFGEPLVLRELDIPTPNARQIVVKTEACAVSYGPRGGSLGSYS
jgi:propanol-preferring alcohol dehydrogenase